MTPGDSPIVRAVLAMGTRFLWFLAFTGLFNLTILFWIKEFRNFAVFHAAICGSLTIVFGLVVYILAYMRVFRLAARRRERTLQEIQNKIDNARKAGCPRNDVKLGWIGILFGLYDRAKASQVSLGFFGILKLLAPLIVQILGLAGAVIALLETTEN